MSRPVRSLVLLALAVLATAATAQTMLVQPYLQDAEPQRMTILWETSSGTESTVQYGTTVALGSSGGGSSFISNGTALMHTVTLSGLAPATTYHYKVITGAAQSALFHFKTPALQSAEAPTNIVAMSDMQRDGSQPNKFWEVVHNGVIEHVNDSMGPDLSEELAMIVIPGDLVDNGPDYGSWKSTFFDPANPLFSYVPVYPVLGNHEINTVHYFNYFQLPDNGTAGYEEHWWYKDHSNVRIIGMDSNTGYRLQVQLDWLDGVLADACTDPDIDFVFAQLHHPHHSELWIAGNTDYTGEVIARMEQFSTNCGKPSIHFFGHTHAYSRGQSRDHTHLMVNVATAGGSIDYWGEFANFDYPEYSISDDEYGYVVVEVEAGADPRFTLKRFSIGDATTTEDNTLEDLISIRSNNNAPMVPVGLFPGATDVVSPDCVVLKGSPFFDADGDGHGDTHWQLSTDCNDWSSPVVDVWRQYQNWYNALDTQAGDDLSDETVTGLQPNTTYCWRVRYRDRSLEWSAWSTPVTFQTGTSQSGPNLLANGNAENGTTGWTATDGVIESLTAGECNGISPYLGTYYFALGALCTDNAYGRAYQDVDVSGDATAIDAGTATLRYGGWFANWQGSDLPKMALEFRNAGGTLLGSAPEIGSNTGTWTRVQNDAAVPVGTRSVRVILTGTRQAGADNDSYMDELYAQLLTGVACSEPYVRVPLRSFLEGAYMEATELMRDDLRTQALVPLTEPFTALGFTHAGEGGGETIDAAVLQTTGVDAVVDWVMIELRSGTSANTLVATRSCLLLRGGTMVDKDGTSTPRITAPPGSYHIVLRHRNHLGVMTAQPIALGASEVTIDLSDPIVPLHGTDAMRNVNGVRVQWMGDSSHDGELKYTGNDNDRDVILQRIGGIVPTATVVGYHAADTNMDGISKYTGTLNDRDPILVNIGGTVPTNTRVEQVP
ncbi:MAG: fibronectin type III domain-containing protein [Flavobacteriales bacterium]|nr:fibronectin type III domain-containing protein [Flavobacteriales bacterium]